MTGLDLVALFAAHGRRRYGPGVSDLEHALQCAALARRAGADEELVLAALLHDVGRLAALAGLAAPAAGGLPAEAPDAHHGHWGAALLRPFVPARVLRVIEQHVVAKRYLCTVDPAYAASLSPASTRSLARQGGVLTDDERRGFEADPWFADAVRLRRWDEAAKDPGALCQPLEAYRALLERHFGAQGTLLTHTPGG